MASTISPQPSFGDEAASVPGPSAHYDMTVSGTQLVDISGHDRHATLVDVGEDAVATYGAMRGLTFDGEGYATLPHGLVAGDDNDFAVEMTVAPAHRQNQFAWVIGDGIGNWNTNDLGSHVFLNPAASANERFQVFAGIRHKTGAGNGEIRVLSDTTLEEGKLNTITLNSSGQTIELYLNGERIASQEHSYQMGDVVPAGERLGYLARSLYAPDPLFQGTVFDVKFWDQSLTQEQIAVAQPSEDDKASALAALIEPKILPQLLGPNASADAVTESLTPPAAVDGVRLTWASSNPEVIAADGVVTRPQSDDVVVTMTVTTVDGATYSYELKVLALSPDNALEADLDALRIPESAHEHLPLAVEGPVYGSTITWSSSDPAIVTPTDENYTAPEVGAADPFAGGGQISRPAYGAGSKSVVLTATAVRGDASVTRDYTVEIEELGRKAPDAGYAAAYFMGDTSTPRRDEKIYMAHTTENDFFTFVESNDKQPVITSTTDRMGLRDPYILRSHNGDRYYMVATDLCIGCGQSWGDAQSQGSLKIMVWESTDLVHWTRTNAPEESGITVNQPEAGMTWAPEAWWDDELQSYVVFFASRLYDDAAHSSITSYHSRMFYVLTRDFVTFTKPPQTWQDTGYSRIDSTIIKIDDHYYRFTKNEEGGAADGLERGKDIFMERSKVLTAPTNRSDWNADSATTWQLVDTAMTSHVTGQAGEGPQIVKLNDGDPNNTTGDNYAFLVDNYGAGGYRAFLTTGEQLAASKKDARISRQADWKVFDPEGKSGLPEHPRHGSFVSAPQQIMDAIANWRGVEPVTSTVEAELIDGALNVSVVASDKGQVAGEVVLVTGDGERRANLVDGSASFDAEGLAGTVTVRYAGYRDQLVAPSSTSVIIDGEGETPSVTPIAEYHFTAAPEDGENVPNVAPEATLGAAVIQHPENGSFEDNSLILPGGAKTSDGTWVRLPDDILADASSATIQIEVKPDASMRDRFHFLWNIGNETNREYLFASLTCTEGRSSALGLRIADGPEYLHMPRGCNFRADEWQSLTAVIDGTGTPVMAKLYLNGELVAQGSFEQYSVKDVEDQSLSTIGRSPWPDVLFKGAIATFRVFDEALSSAQVAALSDSDAELHKAELQAAAERRLERIELPATTETDLTLPTQAGDVTWSSDRPEVIAPDGVVVRPAAGEDPVEVTLAASTSLRGFEATRDFKVTVVPELDDAQRVATDIAGVEIYNADNMRSNFSVPLVGPRGSQFEWTVVDDGGTQATAVDGVRDDAVSVELQRPDAGEPDTQITLRLTARLGDVTQQRDFTVVVPAIKTDPSDYEAYVWSFFTGEGDGAEKVSLAASRGNDALAWNTLNNGNPIFSSEHGEEGLRDPFIIRSHDGDRFYMLATDLKMSDRGNTNFAGAQANGSLYLEIWESDDLVNWSEQRHVKVSPEIAGNTWAPEAFWNEEIGKYVVYWASNLHPTENPDDRSGPTYNRMMYALTDDFVTFSEAEVWIDMRSNNQWGTIDVTMAKEDGIYYRFYKDEDKDMTVRLERSTDMLDTWVGNDSLPTSGNPEDQWSLMVEEIGSGLPNGAGGTFRSGEGPSIFKSNENDVNGYNWFLFIDQPNYHGGPNHYVPFATHDDLADITDDSWDAVGEKLRTNLPQNADGGKPRHGTVIPVTRAEYEQVLRAYQPDIAVESGSQISVTTDLGVAPVLPESIHLTMADGSTQEVVVEWSAIDPKLYTEESDSDPADRVVRTFTVEGMAQDASRAPVTATVTVLREVDDVEPSPEPSEPVEPSPGPSEPVEPSPKPSEPAEPSPTIRPKPGPGDRPGLPSTGVTGSSGAVLVLLLLAAISRPALRRR